MGKGLSVRVDKNGRRHVSIVDIKGPDTDAYKRYLKKNKAYHQRKKKNKAK